MLLEKLWMHRRYDKSINGEIEFVGEVGKISLNLSDEQCKKILAVMGDALIETAKDTANLLTANVIEAVGEANKIKDNQ